MLPVLTPSETALLDRESEARGVRVEDLMENAGRAVALALKRLLGGVSGRRVVVVCGKGNNGGDGLVAGRQLDAWGATSSVVLLARPREYRGAASSNLRAFLEVGGRVVPYSRETLRRELRRADAVVDAVFGTGFRGEPDGRFLDAVLEMNDSRLPLVAVDMPSGVEGETGEVRGDAVRADVTVTFGALKPGVVFHPGAGYAGRVEVVDIGFPPGLIHSDLSVLEASDVARLLPSRPADAHKRSTGVVLVVAGSRVMPGAAALCAGAAYASGAGLVQLAVPPSVVREVAGNLPEATFVALNDTEDGASSEDGWSVLQERLSGVDCVAVGPGLGRHPSTRRLVHKILAQAEVPVVLDADGLNAFEGEGGLLASRRSEAVLTPHAGELGRLLGVPSRHVALDAVAHVRKAAAEFRSAVLLKGPRTVIAEPDGRAIVNPTGGPYLATGGTGDVLTGAIAAFVARGLPPADSAAVAAYVHGTAGALASQRLSEGTRASDVSGHLPLAISQVRAESR